MPHHGHGTPNKGPIALGEVWWDPGLVWTGAGEEKIPCLHRGYSI